MRIYLCVTLKVSKMQECVSCLSSRRCWETPRIGNSGIMGTAVSTEVGKGTGLLTEVMIINTSYMNECHS